MFISIEGHIFQHEIGTYLLGIPFKRNIDDGSVTILLNNILRLAWDYDLKIIFSRYNAISAIFFSLSMLKFHNFKEASSVQEHPREFDCEYSYNFSFILSAEIPSASALFNHTISHPIRIHTRRSREIGGQGKMPKISLYVFHRLD